jgi:hypothetical protein
MNDSQSTLERTAADLAPVLEPHGFEFGLGDTGVSSGGEFATGFFSRPPIRIGLVVRGKTLGLPNYEYGEVISGHDDLVRALGRGDEARLRWDSQQRRLVASDGADVVSALVSDLEKIIMPSLERSPDDFRIAVNAAHAAFQLRLRGGAV